MTEIRVALPDSISELPAKAYLTRTCGISVGLWKRIKHSGTFCRNGVPAVAARTTVRAGDVLSYALPVVSSVAPERYPLDIRYEDDDLLILNKPAGRLVHPTTREPHGTVANAVRGLYEARGAALDFHPCHRLDRNTTGLLLIAKRPEVQYYFAKHRDAVRREYLALAEGTLSPRAGLIDAPIARALPSIILRRVSAAGKPARTHYRTEAADGRYSLLRLTLETGRTHQIRVHLAHLGHPLLGDDLYGGRTDEIARHALHAARLTLRRPWTAEMLTVEAPLPADMARIAETLPL